MDLVVGMLLGAVAIAAVVVVREGLLQRRALARLRADIEHREAPILIITVPTGEVIANRSVADHLGVPHPIRGLALDVVRTFVKENDQVAVRQAAQELAAGVRGYQELTFEIRHADGRWHEILAQGFRLESEGWRRGAVAVTLEDRTESREVVEERDRLFNLSLDLMAVSDFQGRFLQVNPAWVRVLRWSRDDILDRSFVDLIHPEDRELATRAVAELADGLPVRELELRTLARDGSHRWISWSSFPLTVRRSVFTVARDIHDRKLVEEQVARYQKRLQQLARQLLAVEEEERRRLAEVLHDTLAQDLFAAQAKLTLLKFPDRVKDPAAVRDEVAAIIDHATTLARTLTFELFPPALYEVGLDAGLEWLCRSFRDTRGLPCEFVGDDEYRDLPVERRTLLYQGARELLGNVYKHAGASRARVTLRQQPEELELQIDDDGRGIDLADLSPDDSRPEGFGLFNIRERLDQVGGRLAIAASDLGGARVTLIIPDLTEDP